MKEKEEEAGPHGKRAKSAEEALAGLMRYAARAERSSGDALRLMRRWNVPEADRDVREKSSLAGWGVHKIRAGLRAKGIPSDLVEEAVVREYETGAVADRLQELLDRKLRSVSGTAYEVKGKLVRFGLSRGYDYDIVVEAASRAVARTGAEEEEE